jgi:hypothetical protein
MLPVMVEDHSSLLSKRDFSELEQSKQNIWNVFEYEIGREINPNQIGLVVGPFHKISSRNFVKNIYYLPNSFDSEKEIKEICSQYTEFETRVFTDNIDFFLNNFTTEGKPAEMMSMVLVPGNQVDFRNLRASQEKPIINNLYSQNLFVMSEELFVNKRQLEMFPVGFGMALKYKFLSFFERFVCLESENGKFTID